MTANVYTPIERTILDTRDWLIAQGGEVPFELKRRDPEEPGRERKEKMEDKLYAAVMRYFRRQKKGVREILELWYPGRKTIALPAPDKTAWDAIFSDDGFQRDLLMLLTTAAQDGVLLVSELITMDIDYTLVNTAAAKWARKHAGKTIKYINTTTREGLKEIIAMFIETPGMTMREVVDDLMDVMLFPSDRALLIASTEITQAYSEADDLAGEEMKREFPEMEVVKTWWTNNDAIVMACPICWPLHGMTVLQDEFFTTEDDKSYGLTGPKGHIGCRCWRTTTTRFPNA